jgi:hypothetical protein
VLSTLVYTRVNMLFVPMNAPGSAEVLAEASTYSRVHGAAQVNIFVPVVLRDCCFEVLARHGHTLRVRVVQRRVGNTLRAHGTSGLLLKAASWDWHTPGVQLNMLFVL